MKNAKRWLAVILAVTLLGSNAVYQLGTTLSANETEAVTESQQDESENAVAEQAEKQQEDTGKATVQEVTPQEDKPDASAQESKPVQEEGQTQAAQTGSQTPAVVEAPQAEQAQEAAPANAGQSEPEAQAETPVLQTYDVKINKPDLDGGQIKVWGTDGIQTDVTSYDGNNQYVKEVTEGEDFNFQITRNDGFEIENVTVNGVQVAPESTDGSVSTYKLSGVAEEKAITITYNKVETPTEENQDGEAAADEGQKDDAVTEQGGQQADDKVNTASLNDAKETAKTHEDTETKKWITVGSSVTLSNNYESTRWITYSHSWKIKEGNDVVSINASNSNSISVKGKKAGEATITDTITRNLYWDVQQEKTITYTIHVSEAVAPTAITISGADKVTQFKNINLTYTLTPAGAEGTVQWSSSNEDILTVDSSGKVTGLRRGQATVTANVYSGQSLLCSATKTIQVVEDTTVTGESATVYYLLDPTKDANSNDTGNWGPSYGIAKVNVTGATWTGGKNCFDNVDQRVVSWPNGTNVVTRDSDAWNQIFENYKSSIQSQLGVTITKDDVEEITLVPAKISKDNGTTPDKHLDCNVNIKCKNVATVKYYLYDAGAVRFDMLGSKNYVINGTSTTQPRDVTSETFPATKTVNGVTYTFSGWYTNRELTNAAPAFPAKVESSITYFAKYIAGYQVMYNLAGGKFPDGSTNATEKHNEGTNVVVKEEPTRKGYKFTGWAVEGLNNNTTISSGESFTMPGNTVTLTANWEEQKIEDFITLTPTDAERVYNGEPLAAGIATASAKKAEANLDGVKIEYQKADGRWTENPADITATNVADSTTVKVRVTSEKYTGKLEDTEKLTITKRPITITGDGWPSDQPYTGSEYKKTTYTVEEANAENTSGLVAGQTVNTSYEIKGTNVGNYTGTFGTAVIKKGEEDVTANYAVTKTPGTLNITKAEIAQYVTLTPADVTKVYDGNAYAAGTARATDTNGNNLKIEYQKANGSWTEDPTEITATEVKDSVTVNVRVSSEGNYDGYVTGTEKLTITARPITITGDGWTSDQPYTGSEYKKTTYTVEEANAENTSGLVAGQTVNTSYEIKGTNVGNYTGTFGTAVIKKGEEDVTANYAVTKTPGTLNITKAEIAQYVTLTPADVTKVYDGNAYAAGTATAADTNGNDLKIEYQKADGTWTENPTEITASNVSESKTVNIRVSSEGNYDGYVTGTEKLTITARPITITGDGWESSQPYTGSEYKKTDYTVEAANAENTRGLVAGETAEVVYELKGTNVGTYTGTFGTAVIKKGEEDVTANYTVTKTPGTLAIIKSAIENYINIYPVDVTEVYDGEAHAAGTATAADRNGNNLKIEYSVNGTDWTEDPTEITATNVSDITVNVRVSSEGNYDGYVTGTEKLTITPKTVTVTANNCQKTFGEVDPEFAATVVGTLGNDNVDYTLSRETGEDVGDYAITPTGEEKQGNYKVTYKPGTLTIVAAQRTTALSVTSYNGVYDAKKHTITVNGTVDGDKVEYSYNGITWSDKLKEYTDVTDTEIKVRVTNSNYEPAITDNLYGRVIITRRPISITGEGWDTDQLYTGKAYKTDKFEWENANKANTSGLVDGQSVNTTYKLEGTNVSEKPYTGVFTTVQIMSADNKDVTNNYTVKTNPGTLKIVAQSINPGPNPENPDSSYDGIQIDSPSDVEYDGQTHKWSPTVTDKNGNALKAGTDYEVSYDKDDFTDVKTITVTITGKGNYTGTVTRVYNILAAPLIIRTEKAEKTYDGKPLTNENMTIEGLKNGEVVVHKTTGSQTEVGNSDNTYELDWESKETTAKESNYIIKEVSLGKLVVKETEDEIVVTTTGGTFTYDGQPHGATVEVSELPEGYTLQTAESDATATDVTTEAVTADADRLVIVNAAGVDVTANLKITRVTGEIVVNPATVTVTTPNASKVYDGTPLTAAGTITGLVNGETVSFATTGTITNVGTATNSYSLVWDQTAKETNYTVSENLGTLTVTAPANNNPSVTPTPPDNPRPNNPTRPSGQTTEPTGNAFVDNVVTPVVETVKEKAAKIQEVFNSDDEDVPLADQNLDNHKCCILHFLIMLITLLVYALATKSMKKRQKKLHEVREELDCELARRGLPLSREKE